MGAFKIGSKVLSKVENDEIKAYPLPELREAFGSGDEKMYKVAMALLREKGEGDMA